ncbi:DUF5686 and carboxypeptidase-like regulatory domain-containing protein [Taibaiella koreensis]|uniref:DUF5686 and carboxypeptidase-like regulatory domain-containing protein n=1 Tax=Taibaiella koreensis TaxID=1268548 RepID=UPI000E59DFF8|nr:DUF5686 and carboxypeptidase-like regulatory domain-containing protein [Taibaiella koreensis]
MYPTLAKLKKITTSLYVTVLLCSGFVAQAQRTISGIVTDAANLEPLPFATIKSAGATVAFLTDLNGKFAATIPDSIQTLSILYLGYEAQQITLTPGSRKDISIQLKAKEGKLDEVVITPPYDKIRAIINKTISNRSLHRPDNYDWYCCHIYQKTILDIVAPDSIAQDSSQTVLGNFLKDKHVLLSETYSRRTHQKPQKLQDEVLATRISGWKKAPFATLITNVIPFDVYSDYITMNGQDYANPISKGWAARYEFDLVDELQQGLDTLYILSFRPKQKTRSSTLLRGQVYIHSGQYAIAYFLGRNVDESLKRTIKVEQKYQQVDGRWFPQQLNYELIWEQYIKTSKGVPLGLHMKGTSDIDTPQWQRQEHFRFDRAKTILMADGADERPDSAWNTLRPVALDSKESATYHFMDSLYEAAGLDKMLPFMDKLSEGKIPVSIIDFDIKRLYSYNAYEKTRLGLGMQTNERLFKYASIGGWAGYGFHDKQWKYGGFAELYLDRYKDYTIRAGYDNDLVDPGRISIHKDIDRNYLQMWVMNRADKVEGSYIKASARMGYWNLGLEARIQDITPMYTYTFQGYEGTPQFRVKEASLSLRYAFGERRSLVFRRYENMGTKYPIAYLKLTGGDIEGEAGYKAQYLQAVAALSWTKHWNRIGKENFLLMAGISNSNADLPLSKLFAGRGVRNSNPIYASGNFITMYPYDYYTDRFVSLFWKHDFDWKLFKVGSWSNPYISLSHNLLYGSMQNPQVHGAVSFSVPDKGYHESGITLNDVLKYKYLNLAYINLNAGYFYHWDDGKMDLKKNGNFALGVSFNL